MALRQRAPLTVLLFIVASVTIAAVAYLRDPPWLLNSTFGLGAWATDEEGVRYRWTSGHASFFVPSDARSVVLTMRSVKDSPEDRSITASISIDDKPAQRVTVNDGRWLIVKLNLPPRGDRDVRRIDIKLDRLRGRRGIQLQAPAVMP